MFFRFLGSDKSLLVQGLSESYMWEHASAMPNNCMITVLPFYNNFHGRQFIIIVLFVQSRVPVTSLNAKNLTILDPSYNPYSAVAELQAAE